MSQSVAVIRRVGALIFDATFSEQHEWSLEITDSPIETGATISDHAYMLPDRVTISAGVSDTPLHIPFSDIFNDGSSKRSVKALDVLRDLMKSAEPFSVQTGLRLYDNMVCKRISFGQDADTANALIFVAELRAVEITQTQTVSYPPRKSGSPTNQASPVHEHGEHQAAEVATEVKRSQLMKLFGG